MDKCREEFEKFARWYVLPLDKSEDGIYRALETQSAWKSFQRQQAKVEELQKRVDALEKAEFKLAQVKAILQNNPKLLESILVKKIEQALKGEGND